MNEDENNDTVITLVDESGGSGADSDTDEEVCADEDVCAEEEITVNSDDGGGGGGGNDDDYDDDHDDDDPLAPEPVQDFEVNLELEQNSQLPKGKGKHFPGNKNNFKGNHSQQNHDNYKGKGNYKGNNKNSNTGNQHNVKNFNSKTDSSRNFRKNNSNCNNNSSSTNNSSNNYGNYNKSRWQNSSQNSNQKQSTSANNKHFNQHSTPVNQYSKNSASNSCVTSSKNNSNQHNSSSNNKNYSGNNNNNNNSNNYNNNNNSNKNNKTPISTKKDGGGEKVDFLKQVKSIISLYMKKHEVCQAPVDSLVLKLHYQMGLCLFLLTFSMIQGNWFLRESIHCVYNFNAKENVSCAIKNICLSYPYVCEMAMTPEDDQSDCPRRYILFYRWIHFTFLLVAGIYYIPRMIAKKVENPRLQKLIVDLAKGEHRYDGSTWEQDTETMLNYMHSHISTHTLLYFWLLMCHVVALVIDIGAILFFDFILQGQFLGMVLSAYPFHRDPRYFTDELSRTFPPFAHCKLDGSVLINNAREDDLGCHLTLMELYEKVFIFLWIWLAVVTICTAMSVIFLLLVTVPPFNRLFLCMHSSSKGITNLKKKVLKFCGCADLYVLYLLKRHRSEAQFIMFLTRFVHNTEDGFLVGNELKKNSDLNEKPGNTENVLDDPSNMKSEKWFNKNQTQPQHQLQPNLHNYCDFPTPINKSFLTSFSNQDQVRNRKFDASSPNQKFRPPACSPQLGIEVCEDQCPNVDVA